MKKVLAGVLAIAIVSLGFLHRDQILARISCADKVAHQLASTTIVPGAWDCLDPITQQDLSLMAGINSAKDFAAGSGSENSSYTYLGETNDGGYSYRIDTAFHSHNSIPLIAKDLSILRFDLAWSEINGETQGWSDRILTFYLYPSGYKMEFTNLDTGKTWTIDVSGKIEAIT